MLWFKKKKDGGPESPVDAYFFFEIKNFMSIALLKFNPGTRENFHSHAFNALTWFISGRMSEIRLMPDRSIVQQEYKRSILPKFTSKDNLHKVVAYQPSYAFTIRFKWSKLWVEYNQESNTTTVLTNGRRVVETCSGIKLP